MHVAIPLVGTSVAKDQVSAGLIQRRRHCYEALLAAFAALFRGGFEEIFWKVDRNDPAQDI